MPVLKETVPIPSELAGIVGDGVGRVPILKDLKETVLLFRAECIGVIPGKIVAGVEVMGRLVLDNGWQRGLVVVTRVIWELVLLTVWVNN